MVENAKELIVRHLQLVYRTSFRTKWLLELEMPCGNENVTVYLTRPAGETEPNLLSIIDKHQNLNSLLKEDCSALR